jgi:hypothetical protein
MPVILNEFDHARASETLQRLRRQMHPTNLREIERITHLVLGGIRKRDEVPVARSDPFDGPQVLWRRCHIMVVSP